MTPRELVAVVLMTVGLAAWTAGWMLAVSVPVGLVATGAPLTGLGILIAATQGEPEEAAESTPVVAVENGRPVVRGLA